MVRWTANGFRSLSAAPHGCHQRTSNNPLDLAHLINEQQINMVSGTPSRWMTWLTSPDFCEAIAKVNICRAGGEKFSDQLLTLMRSVTKARIFNCYGPTEITVASNNAELTNVELVTVGKPQLNVKEFIVDADGNSCGPDEVGEIIIKIDEGKPFGMFGGYYRDEERTQKVFEGGVYHTTSRATMPSGCLTAISSSSVVLTTRSSSVACVLSWARLRT